MNAWNRRPGRMGLGVLWILLVALAMVGLSARAGGRTSTPAANPGGAAIDAAMAPGGFLERPSGGLLASDGPALFASNDDVDDAAAAPRSSITPERRRFMNPSVSLAQYVQMGVDSIHVWARAHEAAAGDRARLFTAVRGLLAQNKRFEQNVTRTYPRNQVEWLLITDQVADTLAEVLGPVLEKYRTANSEEILTEGRQLLELAMMEIVGPPSRMLGFHVTMLGNHIYAQADSILAAGLTRDRAGLEDGVLRSLDDWCQLYAQVHTDVVSIYECRITQEDWIIARLEDNCGNSGGDVWQLVEQWMAVVDTDSTSFPWVETFAHEFKIKSAKCEDDERVFYIDLPNFHEVQLEVHRRSQEKIEQEAAGSGSR